MTVYALASHRSDVEKKMCSVSHTDTGVIQFEEFKRGVREMVAISDPEMDQLVKIADSNKDGVIDYNEFVRVMQLDNQ